MTAMSVKKKEKRRRFKVQMAEINWNYDKNDCAQMPLGKIRKFTRVF